ncbi:MAG: inorganic diphosphatase [bacterium]|nr:inorganic diphosphatase [bacterium]
MIRNALLVLLLPLALQDGAGPQRLDEHTVVAVRSYLTGWEPVTPGGFVNVVIEIPAGTNAKWEVDKDDGALKWELNEGKPRVVQYLPYPGNYGMVPRTLLPEELGGDGDPLDVIVLGPAVARGRVVRARLVGVLKLLDGGEQDDKLLAVVDGTPLGVLKDLDELNERFPGVTSIVETWFTSYKGRGEMESRGFADAETANTILRASIEAFDAAHAVSNDR